MKATKQIELIRPRHKDAHRPKSHDLDAHGRCKVHHQGEWKLLNAHVLDHSSVEYWMPAHH